MHLIVGIDPGTTTGVAAITLDSRVHQVRSSRNMGVDQVVKYVTSLGRASIIASDVTPTPDSVLKIASSLGCAVFTLYESLPVREKNLLARDHNVEDLHSRDALAAALNVYNKYKNKLQKIASLGYDDEVKHRVLQGKPLERVLSEMNAEKHAKTGRKTQNHQTTTPPRENSRILERQNRLLREQIKLQDFEISELRKKISSTPAKPPGNPFQTSKQRQQDQVIDSLQYKIKKLEQKLGEIDDLKHLWRKLATGKIIPIGVYPEIYAGITHAPYRLSQTDLDQLENARIVYTEDAKNKQNLSKKDIPTADPKTLHKQHGLTYLTREDHSKLTHTPLNTIENIVDEYRKHRTSQKH